MWCFTGTVIYIFDRSIAITRGDHTPCGVHDQHSPLWPLRRAKSRTMTRTSTSMPWPTWTWRGPNFSWPCCGYMMTQWCMACLSTFMIQKNMKRMLDLHIFTWYTVTYTYTYIHTYIYNSKSLWKVLKKSLESSALAFVRGWWLQSMVTVIRFPQHLKVQPKI